jgi:hypothetical protein
VAQAFFSGRRLERACEAAGLSPLGKIKSRRNREMVEKQVCTMATAEKIASGGDWYIFLWTADAKVWVQKTGGVYVVSEGA